MHLIGHRKTKTEQLLEQGQHLFDDLTQRAAPHVEAARTRLVSDVIPAAQERAAQARELAQDRALPAAAAAAALAKAKADEHLPHRQQKKESHKVRNTLMVLGLAGLGAAAWKKMTGRQDHLPYVPPTADRAPASTLQVPPQPRHAGPDAAGADPAEALSDAAEGPHLATTPDSPREAEFLDREP